MKINFKKAILPTVFFFFMLTVAGIAAAAVSATTVNLTAQRTSTTLSDGTSVLMWGYCGTTTNNVVDGSPSAGSATGGACNGWAPGPTIVLPYSADGTSLTINLTNNLPIPTSMVILGQLGGGLGTPVKMNGPAHSGQNFTTFPGNGLADISFVPPAQAQRVKSFATEVPANANVSTTLAWSNLKPGTYLYETGTLPSIQVPMGLYGVLIVTQAPVTSGTSAPGKAYPGRSNEVTYDSDAALLFSEIDPVQNNAVDAAAVAGTDVNKRFNDPGCTPNCYPAAVNYTPTYFLINGKVFDKTNPQQSSFLVPGFYSSGKVLLRMLNAGLRTHIPSIVGLDVSIVAEDGNFAPGNPKQQNQVLLPAGKTHDVLVSPAAGTGGNTGSFAPATFPVFDRALSLTTANQPDGGMQGFLLVNGATTPSAVAPTAVADTFSIPLNTSINGDVRVNDIAVVNAAIVTGNDPNKGTLIFNSDGTFVYTPAAGFSGVDSFTYNGNGGTTNTVIVTLNIASQGVGTAPVAGSDNYTSNVTTKFSVSRPGVLANDIDLAGYPLIADPASVALGTCGSVVLNTDGSFTTTPGATPASCSFTYKARNSQGTLSNVATVTVAFGAPGTKTGLKVALVDAKTNDAIADYRWIIQEDLTFKHDTTVTPSLGTRTIGTSFHKSHMPVVATGCVGQISCGSGQQVRGTMVDPQPATTVDKVALDPNKNYYISVLPGDAQNPVIVGTCGDPSITNPNDPNYCNPAGKGHMMGGAEIKPSAIVNSDTVTIRLQPSPLQPAQLSVFIYEDNAPTNNQNDLNETGLGGFNIILQDPAGRIGDVAGQQTYDAFNMPLTNALLGTAGCPNEKNSNTVSALTTKLINGGATPADAAAQANLVGVIYTCPNAPPGYTGDPAVYALAGHALIKNLTPARYDVLAHPGAEREGAGEVWWQTETLEGTPAQDAFVGVNEPRYFQEFGPPGFHTTIGFVNPDKVRQYAMDNSLTGTYTVSGKITNQHMSRPSNVTLWDSGAYDLLSSSTCQVALNSEGGDGPAIATAQCDKDGNFTVNGVPPGDYELAIWDQWLDQIIQFKAVTVNNTNVALGNIPVFSWFTQYDQNIFMDTNKDGIYDANEPGIANALMTSRYRNGSIHMQTATDSSGNGLLAEMFPLFNWYVVEADTTRFKQTGVNITVDGGGAVDTLGPGAGLWASSYATGETSVRTEIPGAYSYGLQSFISQRNTINWGRAPYATGENGGIQGTVVYSSTRPFDDQRYNVQNIWAPLVPRVTVNLYRKEKLPDGTSTLGLVDTTQTSSWDDWVNAVDANGKQVNLQCPGQRADDPFLLYTLAQQNPGGAVDQFRCYDGFHNWNQAQAAPYDGRYNFPSAAYANLHPLTSLQSAAGQTLVSLPPGDYVVEAVTPPGYEIVKEEDKNILIGDAFIAPVTQQFGALGSIFILPDQATLNNANSNNPGTGDPGFQTNPTSNLGVIASLNSMPECVGNLHRVPDYLSIYPQAQQVAPFAGMDRPLCDRKLVQLGDQMQASANFFVYTPVPLASNNTGIILDDASAEFNVASPDFGEKASVPFVPVSIKDFNGLEISRTYSDQWGAYNMMTPSSWLVNPPTPSGYGPNMLITCMNDPGPIAERDQNGVLTGRMITDPAYNPAYSNFCYTNSFMPGLTTYLDTPVLPIAAFAAGYNPADCAYPDATPAIARVDSSAGFGPYLPMAGGTLTIRALGDQLVQNPAYAGPFATSGPASQRTITRHYGFGGSKGMVKIGDTVLTTDQITSWDDSSITVNVPANTPSGELVITAANGKYSVDAVTVTVEDAAPKRVQGALGQTIQSAIEAAAPGDLILIEAGTYNELVIMWKPVRLQGVGAASVIINAAKYPNAKLDGWRTRINQLFSIDSTGNLVGTAQVDPLPTQEITGGVVLLEPSVLGTEEGAGITVLAKALPADQCVSGVSSTIGSPVTDSNFLCKPSRIDGVSVTGGDSGGGIYVNGWAHGLEIANNRIYGNAGAFHGGVRVGVPYLELVSLPINAGGGVLVLNGEIAGFGFDEHVRIHHNAITKNGTIEGPAGNGGAGGGVSICTGTDDYSIDHNWICGNISASDGGGIGHIGFSQNGRITDNSILFNQSFQQTGSTHGGGIVVIGEPPVAGTVSLGTGNLTIDANLIRGNFAEGGQGGGIRLQQVNGGDVEAFPNNTGTWFQVILTNNMVVNNVAGWAGGGISMADTIASALTNNTVASNDSAGIAGVVLASGVALPAETPGVAGVGKPGPSGINSEPTSAQLQAVLPLNTRSANAISKPGMINNIVWKNRSFYYSGNGQLCASNDTSTATGTPCATLPDQAITGQCVAGAQYWDLGVLGDVSTTPNTNVNLRLDPVYSVLTSIIDYSGTVNGQPTNRSADPLLAEPYCNGSRITPEFSGVINPPSPKNLQVAATVDEGNNYVNMRYGPLTLAKPADSNGTSYVAFGDYHLSQTATASTSSAVDHGTLVSVVTDIDGDHRPSGAGWDIGADELVAKTDLMITKTDGVTIVAPGDKVTYTIVVTNAGPSDVTGAIVNDPVPSWFDAARTPTWTCTASAGSSCALASGNGAINNVLLDMLQGGTATFIFTGYVSSTVAFCGVVSNTATVTAPAGVIDTIPGENSATDRDGVACPIADLSITKSVSTSKVAVNGTVVYTIKVTNNGPGAVTGAVVRDIRPRQLNAWSWSCAPVGAVGCGTSGNSGTGNIVKTLGTLNPGDSVTITIIGARVNDNTRPGITFANTVTVSPPPGITDPNPANNTASVTVTVARGGEVSDRVTPPLLSIRPAVVLGAQSSTRNVTVTSTGTATLVIGGIVLGGAVPGDFTIVAPTTGTPCVANVTQLARGGTCTIGVRFAPTVANRIGLKRASLTITSNATTKVVQLNGIAR